MALAIDMRELNWRSFSSFSLIALMARLMANDDQIGLDPEFDKIVVLLMSLISFVRISYSHVVGLVLRLPFSSSTSLSTSVDYGTVSGDSFPLTHRTHLRT